MFRFPIPAGSCDRTHTPSRDRLMEIRPYDTGCLRDPLSLFFLHVVSITPSGEPEGFFHDLFGRLHEWRIFQSGPAIRSPVACPAGIRLSAQGE